MKFFIIGFLVGVVSFIPGISGGTILYMSKEYENFTYYLKTWKTNYKFLLSLLIGLLFGVFIFAKIIEFCFNHFPNQILLFFSFLILLTIPKFLKDKQIKFKPFYVIIGFLFLLFISTLNPNQDYIINNYPTLSLSFLIFFTLCGFLDGFITIIPGISGSMIMMILGPYYLYKSFAANAFTNPQLLIFLLFYFLGDLLGIIIGAKTTTKLLEKQKDITHSLILGMVISSIFIILPLNHLISLESLILFLIAYILITITNLFN